MQPYLYKLTQKSTGKWYVGSRTAKNCKPDEGYICSSRHVKPLYLANPSDWTREILVIGPVEYIRDLEARYLCALDAKHDSMSFNLHNGDGKFTTAGKKFISAKPHHLFSPEVQEKKAAGTKRAWAAGLYACRKWKKPELSKEQRDNLSKRRLAQTPPMQGKKHTEETKAKMAAARAAFWAKNSDKAKNVMAIARKSRPSRQCPHCLKMFLINCIAQHEKKCAGGATNV